MDKNEKNFLLRGNIIYSKTSEKLTVVENGYVVCKDGVCMGVFKSVPKEFSGFTLYDYGDELIVPGLVDLHTHAPQFGFRGTGMDLELMDWLEAYAFPEECRFADDDFANRAYGMFVNTMLHSATTRLVVFGTRHRKATEVLMDLLEQSGLCSFVGKVNMDRLGSKDLVEKSAAESYSETVKWLSEIQNKYKNTKPVITPRFVPACSNELLANLGKLAALNNLPVQSHLSENVGEVQTVKKLVPDSPFYGEVYDRFGLFGQNGQKCVMAHCVLSTEPEIDLMKKNGVFVAHCPESNANISSGIAPIRKYITHGLKVGLGTDIAAGSTESIFSAMTDAIRMSKLYRLYVDKNCKALTFPEAFYMATLGGGEYFGKVGSFEPGFEFDAVVLDDCVVPMPCRLSPIDRLERFAYLKGDIAGGVKAKFVRGSKLF